MRFEFMLLGAGLGSGLHGGECITGIAIVEDMIDGLNNYLDEKGFASVNDNVGKSVSRVTDWGNLDLNYDVKAHVNNEHCIRCNLCYVACEDGAHQSLSSRDRRQALSIRDRRRMCPAAPLRTGVSVAGAISMVV